MSDGYQRGPAAANFNCRKCGSEIPKGTPLAVRKTAYLMDFRCPACDPANKVAHQGETR